MKTLDDLWYVSGTVHVALKDKVFQPSNIFRNTKELVDIANYLEDGVSAKDPVMFLYGAGGLDNRTIFKSVKIAAIYIFMALDLDVYIAARTAPELLGGGAPLTKVKYTLSILQVYFNLIKYRRRSILQVYIISTKEVHLKHILWN